MGAPLELIASDVLDHYRTYSLLERLLAQPSKLSEQPSFQLEPQSRSLLIEKYYCLDDYVARELLGKKLSSRYRKDLDEVAERTGVRLKSCRRQFDNVKRVFKVVEDMAGHIANNVKHNFMLSDDLARWVYILCILSYYFWLIIHIFIIHSRKYAAIVFLASLRFETSKRKLQHLNFSDFLECAQAIMTFWTYTYQHTGPEYYDTEMDKEFLLDLRELRCLLDKEKEIKQYVYKHKRAPIWNVIDLFCCCAPSLVSLRLKPTLLERAHQELDTNFRYTHISNDLVYLYRRNRLHLTFTIIIST